jgi:NAD(P)H-hydrate repair Nnr-like enzyme with NAD(P)H-hydrate dehydratase domain
LDSHRDEIGKLPNDDKMIKPVVELANKYHNVLVLKKGIVDLVSDGSNSYFIAIEGGLKRCGG